MAKTRKQSASFLTRCFRPHKVLSGQISIGSVPTINSIIDATHRIDQIIQAAESMNTTHSENTNSISIEQIEDVLRKWTSIAHYLIETYRNVESVSQDRINY